MKSIILVCLALLGLSLAVSPPHPCPCWPDWHPEKTEEGEWQCKDANNDKTFHCNIDVPPKCVCKEKGVAVDMPFGEINCVGDTKKTYDDINCDNRADWEPWFTKYPQYRLYH